MTDLQPEQTSTSKPKEPFKSSSAKEELDWKTKLSASYLYKELGIEEFPKCKRSSSKLQAGEFVSM